MTKEAKAAYRKAMAMAHKLSTQDLTRPSKITRKQKNMVSKWACACKEMLGVK